VIVLDAMKTLVDANGTRLYVQYAKKTVHGNDTPLSTHFALVYGTSMMNYYSLVGTDY